MKFTETINRSFKPTNYTEEDGLLFWREKFFLISCFTFVLAGSLAYIASMKASISAKLWQVAIIDTLTYLLVVMVFFFNKINLKFRIYTVLSLGYFLSVSLLIYLGPYGPGIIWLILIPFMAALFLGTKAAILSNSINLLTLVILGFLIGFHLTGLNLFLYNLKGWIAVCSNYLLISLAISLPVSILLQVLDKSLRNEKELKNSLKTQNQLLKKAKDIAENADKLKSISMANMAHEIRTPMNGILGFSILLFDNDLDKAQQRRYTKIIQQRAEYLLRLINNIIDLSKIESGQLQVEIEVVNINKLLNEIYEMFISQIESAEKNIQLIPDIQKDKKITILSDATKIQQVLINLIGNAIKFTESGAVKFGFKIQNNFIEFYVKDTGIGIQENDKSIIFERYGRIENQNQHISAEGTGLGLSISMGLAKLLNGDIWFESEANKGSTFYFSVPLREIEAINDDEGKNNNNMTTNWKEKTILIVEDDPISAELLGEVLTETDAIVEYATDGNTAIEICKNKKVDIVLMDIQLPGMNGQTALYEIKKLDKKIIVVAQTAFAMSGDKEKYILQGFDDYISKPIYPNILIDLLNKYIES